MNRRQFLGTSLSSVVGMTSLQSIAFATSSDEKPRVALIGCGWYGKTDLFHLLQVTPAEVVALCDVDQKAVDQAATLVADRQESKKRPTTYGDYRQLLADHKPEIVLIGTPDHWHCLPMVDAVKGGADVYVQKPISIDVMEGRAMVAAARKYQRTVQVGLQRRSTPHLLEALEKYVRSGKLGTVAMIDIHSYYGSRKSFPPAVTPPENLNWDMYVGPAAWRDYHPGVHPRSWRDFREFSNGQTGDLCVHMLDTIRYYFGLGWPKSIAASGGNLLRPRDSNVNVHDTQTALFDYGSLQVAWNQRNWGENPDPDYPWGATIYGDLGTLKISVWKYTFIPKGSGEKVTVDAVDEREKYPKDVEHKETELFAAPATRRHMQNFLAARRDKKRPVADIEEGHISSACCILANNAMALGRSIQLDPATGAIKGDPEAEALLTRPYRAPWQHPTPDNV